MSGAAKELINKNRFILSYKKSIIIFTKILIAIGLLTFTINFIKIDTIVNAFEQANLFLILLALGLSVINIYLQFYKWKLTSQKVLGDARNSKILISLFYGFSAAVFTPARIGEYFGRTIAFKDRSLIQVTTATLIDKLFPLFVVTFFGSISSILFIYYRFQVTFYLILGLFITVFVLFSFVTTMIFSERFWKNVLIGRIKNSTRFSKYLSNINILENLDKKYATEMIVVSVLFYICFLIQYALLVSAFSNQSNFLSYLWAGNLLMFAKTVIPPISLGELGIREGASVYFITQIGLGAAVGFNASIFLFLINILLPALIGLILLAKKNND